LIPDFLDLLEALLAARARFLIVGGYAVGIHGYPRATKDLDVWLEASDQNAPRVMEALRAFGAPLHGLTEEELQTPGMGLQIGVPPGRIDVLTQISGVEFEEAWPERLEASFFGRMSCPVIGRAELLKNKRASGRAQDLADVEALERLTPLSPK
jgi:hypothetical protein